MADPSHPPYPPGTVFFANVPLTNNENTPILKTRGHIGGHPIIVIEVDAFTKMCTCVAVQTFGHVGSLDDSELESESLYKWFLPVIPAQQESIHIAMPTRVGSLGLAEWVNLRDKFDFGADQIKASIGTVPTASVTAIKEAMIKANKAQ